MRLTSEGREIVEKLDEIMREVMGIDAMEQKLQKLLEVDEVIIVPGDCDVSPWVKRELGKACALRMKAGMGTTKDNRLYWGFNNGSSWRCTSP